MKVNSFLYSFRQGIRNIKRNHKYSLATCGTIITCLFLLGIFLSLIMNFNNIMKSVENGVSFSVYFKEGISTEQITQIGKEIQKRKGVDRVEYISAEKAWKDFSKEYMDGDSELIEGYGEENPLANSANYKVYLKKLSDEKALVKDIKQITGVRSVRSSEITVKNLLNLSRFFEIASVVIIIILMSVAVFLISNTVIVGISMRKEEISIMKLLGATDFFIRTPFVVEGIVLGLAGALIPCGVLTGLYFMISEYIRNNFGDITQWMNILPTSSVFAVVCPVCIGLGVLVGFLGSFLTVRKHLSVLD